METNADVFMAIRKRIRDAVESGALDPAREELLQGTLLQLMSECERKRQAHEAAAARLMEQYHRELGQRDGMSALSSMIQGLIQANILRAQRDALERREQALEKLANAAPPSAPIALAPQPKAKRGRRGQTT